MFNSEISLFPGEVKELAVYWLLLRVGPNSGTWQKERILTKVWLTSILS